jgi:hypothetical protein
MPDPDGVTGASPEFLHALIATYDDVDRFGQFGDLFENGAMRAVGINRADALRMAESFTLAFEDETLDGLADEERSVRREKFKDVLFAAIEWSLATGVHLERHRWEQLERLRGEGT